MVDIKKFNNIDLYGLLDVQFDADEKEIRKAYRRKALTCHPDKNPDNPKAAELFHQLSEALEVLCDESARVAYDRVLNAKKAAAVRHQQLDAKRQKLIEDLNRREQAANDATAKRRNYSTVAKSPEEQLQAEMERLRKEGSRLLAEEQELMRKQLEEERMKMAGMKITNQWDPTQHRIKIKWKAEKTDDTNGGYSEETLRKYLQKYGEINAFAMSKKRGSALIEFKTQDAAEMAVAYEKGDLKNPLTLSWIGEAPRQPTKQAPMSSTVTESDFESLVLRQMRQAEERKKLIAEMMKEDS